MKRFVLFIFLLSFYFNISAQFTPGNIVVLRVGDGSTALSSAAFPVSLLEYTIAGALVTTTNIPTTDATPNLGMTQSGTASSEGALSLSGDGRYLTVAGYNAAVGTAGVSTGNNLGVISSIDYNRNVTSSTSFIRTSGNAYVSDNFRAVTTDDGSGYWGSGNTGGSYGGVRYILSGTSGAGTQISNTIVNTRAIKVISDQLYVSSGTAMVTIGTVGSGLQTTSGQFITNLSGLPIGTYDPYGFVLLDADASVPGPDLLYFCSLATGAGLYKYSYDGTTWTAKGNLTGNLFGITAWFNCSGGVNIFVTKGTIGKPTDLYSFTDTAAYNSNITSNGLALTSVGVGTLLANAGSNYSFGGVAFAPTGGGYITSIQNINAGNYNAITVKSGGIATLTGNITVYDRIVVESGGALIMGTNTINSPAGIGNTFEVKTGGIIKIGSPYGITTSTNGATGGNVQTCKRIYSSGATYEYGAAMGITQVTGNGLPVTISGKLKINTQAGLGTTGVSLSQNTQVNGEFILTDGKLTTSQPSNMLTLGSSSVTTSAYADNSFVNGVMSKYGNTPYEFPVGEGVDIHPLKLETTGGNTLDIYTVVYFKSNPSSLCTPGTLGSGIDHISKLEYWFAQCIPNGSPSNQVTLWATGYSYATDRDRLVITNCSSGTWANLGNANTGNIGAVGPVTSLTAVSGFFSGVFSLASLDPSPINPLPITLISFDAFNLSNTKSSISWELGACCSAAAKFEIQRAGKDRGFVTIATIGGSETNRFYNYLDNNLKSGINYYRLKMIDEDGKITYSRTVAVMNGVDGLLLTSLIPTIVTNTSSLTIASSKQQKLDIIIVDMQGRVMLKRNITIAAGNSNIELPLHNLAAGVYQLTGVTAEGKTNTIRFLKQ